MTNPQIPASVLRENALRKAPKTIGQMQSYASDASMPTAPGEAAATGGMSNAQAVYQNAVFVETLFNGNLYLGANPKRTYLLIQNQGAGTLFFSTTATGTLTSGGQVAVGGSYEPNVPPVNQISITGTGYVIEGSGT